MPTLSRNMINDFSDLSALVNESTDRFETLFQSPKVSEAAREALIAAMLPHIEEVKADLKEGKITYRFLEQTLFSVLSAALEIKKRNERELGVFVGYKSPAIDDSVVQTAMKKECNYLGWC